MPEKSSEQPPVFNFQRKTETGIAVTFSAKNEKPSSSIISKPEAGEAIFKACGDPEFMGKVGEKIGLAAPISRIDCQYFQEGWFEYIFLATVTGQDGTEKKIILATSQGLQTPEAALKILKNQEQGVKDSEFRPLYAAFAQQLTEKQMWHDYQGLGHLRRVFKEKNLPVEVPEPYAFTTQYVKSEKAKDLQPVSILAMEMLAAPENCPVGEINPRCYLPQDLPGEGFTWYWSLNIHDGELADEWNSLGLSKAPEDREKGMRWMQEKTAEALAYVYFATGRLPFWFSPPAGDILFLGESPKIRAEKDFHLGLITVRGGLHSLEPGFVPGETGKSWEINLPRPSALVSKSLEVVEQPDLLRLFDVLQKMKTEPQLFDYGDSMKDNQLARGAVPLFSRPEWLARSVVRAYETFYKRNFNLEDLPVVFDGIPVLKDKQVRVSDILGKDKLSKLGPVDGFQIMKQLPVAVGAIAEGLSVASSRDIRGDCSLLKINPRQDTNDITTISFESHNLADNLFSFVFGPPVETFVKEDGKYTFNCQLYEVRPELVAGKNGVKVQVVTEPKSGRTYFEFFRPT